jgi:hypothetical protein
VATIKNKFWDKLWVKIPLYFLSILFLVGIIYKWVTYGNEHVEIEDLILILIFGGYLGTDLMTIHQNKIKDRQIEKTKSAINEIGKSGDQSPD